MIGYGDDHTYCYSSFPVLSRIGHPAREIGRRAADVLWRRMMPEAPTAPPGYAVIFDMDGTLFDSESLFFQAFARADQSQEGGHGNALAATAASIPEPRTQKGSSPPLSRPLPIRHSSTMSGGKSPRKREGRQITSPV